MKKCAGPGCENPVKPGTYRNNKGIRLERTYCCTGCCNSRAPKRKSKITDEEIAEMQVMHDSGYSMVEIIVKFDISYGAMRQLFINKRIVKRDIELHDYKAQSTIRKIIIRDGLLDYECSSCGLTDSWQGKSLVLEIDHINGKNDDNRIGNLRFLCPNCHSQTDTFRSKNAIRKRDASQMDASTR